MRLWSILFVAVVTAQSVGAKIISTRPSPSETWNPVLALTVGGGFEFETDSERSLYEFPFLIEYNLTEQVRLSIEPNVTYQESKTKDEPSVAGGGDLETSLEWEFLRERRYRPALTLEGIIRWPTATDSELGDPGRDYTLGVIASKDFVFFEMDVGVHYTSIGENDEHDLFELTVAAEVPINHRLYILLESVTDFETGRSGRNSTEGTAGLGWRVNEYLTLEAGCTLESDGTWKALFAWEWNFAGED